MSAYVLNDVHLLVLVQWASLKGVDISGPGGCRYDDREVALVLRRQNVRSVNSRYPTEGDHDLPLVWRRIECSHVPPVAIIKMVQAYEYNACEDAGWPTSIAKSICRQIRNGAIDRLEGYVDAPWSLRDPAELKQYELGHEQPINPAEIGDTEAAEMLRLAREGGAE